ncbi:flagellar protein FlaG [Paenibacillus taichungensis]|uniref:flagellar protein FlaG n=1 Tax=Paenibacillus taichungensis TaxID=484184 RepID=UPI002DBABB08|nr:flagellar protein FlaG [Paenibacillus taichungensis]MEC0106229.1 flagellar protein FlaG [Paenibacillus taichungensis]MEC0199350.1 flagellar protein FlaG [Paenibacillus taichungensis]
MSTNATPGSLGMAANMSNSSSYVKTTRDLSEGNKQSPDVNTSVIAAGASIPQIAQDREQMLKDLERAIRAIQGPQKTLEISVHDATHTIMIKVKNQETGDVIREIPSEKILDVLSSMMEHAGIVIDKKV